MAITPGALLDLRAAIANANNTAPHSNADADKATWYDYTTNSRDLTLTGFAFDATSGWAGSGSVADPYCLVYDGTNDLSAIVDAAWQEPTNLTVECWFRKTDTTVTFMGLVEKFSYEGGNSRGFMFDFPSAGQLRFYLGTNQSGVGSGVLSSSTALNDGAWHHAVGTWDGTTQTLYIDGAYQTSATPSPVNLDTPQDLRIGGDYPASSTNPFKGSIAQARLYDFALSAGQVSANYAAGVNAGADASTATPVTITPRTTAPPQLHHVYIFDAGDTLRTVATNGAEGLLIVSDLHTESIDGTNTYELVLTDHPDITHVQPEGQLMFRDVDGRPRLMRIKQVATKHDGSGITHTVTAHDAIYELGGTITRTPKWEGKTVGQVLGDMLTGTRWTVEAQDTAMRDFSLGIVSVWEGIRAACEAYGVEFYTTCDVSGRKVTNRTLHIVTARGENRGMTFMWGRDIKSLDSKRATFDTATAILPLGASDSDGAYVTIASVTASDKPATQDWIGDEEARALYGPVQADGTRAHMTRVVNFPDIRDVDELLAAARTELARVKAAVLSVDVDAALLDELGYDFLAVRVGDTVGVTDPATGTSTTIRVPEVRRSYTKPGGS